MQLKRVDLHIHTHASDGQFSPSAVVHAAVRGRLDVIAITDHDTVAGVREALDAAQGQPISVIPGVELSTRHGPHEIHILGYFIDPDSPALRDYQHAAGDRRAARMQEMVRRVRALGGPVQYDDVLRVAGPEASSLGRPHLARALVEAGHVRSVGEAFDLYLKDGGPAFVETEFPGVREAMDTIHKAGGVAIWAHPELEVFDREIRTFRTWGLNGIECFRPNTPPVESMLYEKVAREMGLYRSGGSDWHGPHRGRLGDWAIRSGEVRELLASRGVI
ncbi:MAG TPA: PHP domain-containing protein [Longimicrobiaceae bacterium]|nr:PHP domain-containing protein [Longimicrobiaceae bacterium]